MSTVQESPESPAGVPVNRRKFLSRGFLGAGALALGGIAYRVAALPDGAPATAGGVLTRTELSIVSALSLALFPPGNPFDLDGVQADVPGYLDRYMARLPAAEQKILKALIWVYDQGTVLDGNVRPIRSMSNEDAQAYVKGWETSRFGWRRDLAMSLRTVLGFGYFAHPKVKAILFYEEPCHSGGPSLLSKGATA
jgi:hypothetical protein